MPMELTMPVLALTGAALTALTWRLWPRIAVRTYREKHPEFGIREIALSISRPGRLIGAVERRGYTLVPLELYWKAGRAKLAVGLAKGKKQHDKRAVAKDRDWTRDKARVLKRG